MLLVHNELYNSLYTEMYQKESGELFLFYYLVKEILVQSYLTIYIYKPLCTCHTVVAN